MALEKILLVDDSEADQYFYQAVIGKYDQDIEVAFAFDGQEALDVLSAGGKVPDAILLDINMPGMNGFDFLEAYSRKYTDGDTVVVMLTSSAHNVDKDKALAYPCVRDFFVKPVTVEHLKSLQKIV